MSFKMYFILFIAYSFIGWFVEVMSILVKEKKFVNRGFLIGPYCPIYGVGGLAIIFLLKKYMEDPIALFIMATIVCSILEYFTSYLMEKLFKTRWWDYSGYRFNINGRICLETMWAFGALACFVMYIVNPPLIRLLKLIPTITFDIIFYIIMVTFMIDSVISFKIISNVKLTVNLATRDSTEEITKYVRRILSEKSLLSKRLVNAFPNFKLLIKNIKSELTKERELNIKFNKKK